MKKRIRRFILCNDLVRSDWNKIRADLRPIDINNIDSLDLIVSNAPERVVATYKQKKIRSLSRAYPT